MAYDPSMRGPLVVWLLVPALAAASALSAQSGAGAATRKLRAAIRAIDVSEESGHLAVQAAAAMQPFDGRQGARALLDAVEELERRVAAVSETRRKALAREGDQARAARAMRSLTCGNAANRATIAAGLVALMALGRREIGLVLRAAEAMEIFTRDKPDNCVAIAEAGGVAALVQVVASCGWNRGRSRTICSADDRLSSPAKVSRTMPQVSPSIPSPETPDGETAGS